jgi:hypothetical protein
MKIGIIGFGFVGKANYLFQHPSFEYMIYDIDETKCLPIGTNL